ncbi:MAG: hypothetical protein KGI66_03750, partial [Patescibacteria group bacterium]|nr:hypothetical protein [Patescibacteria group bacterium]
IVQRNRERFRFQCSDNGIATGSVVKLALRTDKGCRTGVWLSAVDRYMYPVPSMSMTGHAGN